MKTVYQKPTIEVLNAQMGYIICGSRDIYSDKDIIYGGVDEEGTMDPSAREFDMDDEEFGDE
jgi:hypothetical protein